MGRGGGEATAVRHSITAGGLRATENNKAKIESAVQARYIVGINALPGGGGGGENSCVIWVRAGGRAGGGYGAALSHWHTDTGLRATRSIIRTYSTGNL
jgi:hypothetical protein